MANNMTGHVRGPDTQRRLTRDQRLLLQDRDRGIGPSWIREKLDRYRLAGDKTSGTTWLTWRLTSLPGVVCSW